MGCFLGCFGSKDHERRKQRYKVIPRYQNHGIQIPLQTTISQEQGITENLTSSFSEIPVKPEEQLSSSTRKRVTFDSNVKTYEHVSVCENTDSLLENNKGSDKEKEESLAKLSQSQSLSHSEDDSFTTSIGSYPPNHRYQNCRDSDDEVEELEYEDSDLDDEDDDVEEQEDYGDYDEDCDASIVCQEVWSESIPTASIESRTEASLTLVITEEVKSPMTMPEQEAKTVGPFNRNARDRSVYVHPVLNPVENLTQWKAVKSKGTPPMKPRNENFTADQEALRISFCSEPSFKQSSFSFNSQSHQPKNPNQETAVDASLSNWLVSSETTPPNNKKNKASTIGFETITTSEKSMSEGSTSVMSIEDRPILGALTVEELKQFSASSSPRRSPSRSPDEMPIIGTVGTYWCHTGPAKDCDSGSSYKGVPNTTSKYREDKRVNWHSTPFETRLERALNRDAAEA